MGHANWRAEIGRQPRRQGFEVFLHGDGHATGQCLAADLKGPYEFLNTLSVRAHAYGERPPPLVLRVWIHLTQDQFFNPTTETDTSGFHGGSLADEIGSLASLLLGTRLRAGGITRRFDGPQELGWPIIPSPTEEPEKLRSTGAKILPRVGGCFSLDNAFLARLQTYPSIDPVEAVGLARAARLYSDALWVAESQPHLAWLFLVSALEAGANTWKRQTSRDRVALLRDAKPELVKLLEGSDARLVPKVALQLADTMKATRKFRDFIMEFEPRRPLHPRPPQGAAFRWTRSNLRRAVTRVYELRSRALHEGIPFPPPLCVPPERFTDEEGPSEVALGLATAAKGGVWVSQGLPMLLHVFEYLTQSVLTSWWDRMVAGDSRG